MYGRENKRDENSENLCHYGRVETDDELKLLCF